MASQTMQCAIGIDYAGFGTTAYLRCRDIFGHELFAISGKGVAISEGGELKAALDEMAQAGKLGAHVEGLWTTADESAYRLGIVSVDSGREFVIVTFESPRTFWQPGMVKARLTATADGRTFAAKWRMGDRREASGIASLKGGTLILSVTREGKDETITLIKLRPTVTAAGGGTLNSSQS